MAGLVCLTAVLLFWRYRRDEVKQLIHRQKLARMVLENKWYESEQRKDDAFFKDLSSSRSKETITYFPKIYYRMKQGLLHIRVEITLDVYKRQGQEEEAKSVLIEHNLRLVVYIAKKFDNTGVGVEDLISIGTIGPVSYTHLDVYKRQLYCQSIMYESEDPVF